jgi:regulator of RNase E activity RraA
MPPFDQAVIDAFRRFSTPSLATALYKRGLRNQVIQGVRPVGTTAGTMVGAAYTLRYIPAREDLNPISVFQDPAHVQRRAVEECPPGYVLVMDSRGDPRAASGGGILLRRLMIRGCAGVVTDGGFRDSAEIGGYDMPAFHQRPSPPTNLTLHHAMDLDIPIGCGGAPVFPGDLVVGDADGVIVIPAHLVDEIASEVAEMEVYETFVVEMVRAGTPVIGLYPMTDPGHRAAFARWRAEKGR